MSTLFPPRPRSPPATIPSLIASPPPRRRSRALPRNIPIDTIRRGFRRIGRSRPVGTRAPASGLRGLDALEETSAGLLRGVERVSANGSDGGHGHEGQADGLALGVGAVELADGEAGVGEGFVGHECGAVGAAGAVVAEGKGEDGTDAGEEVLVKVGGRHGYAFREGEGVHLGLLL